MPPHLEAKARIKINKLLEEAGWRFFDDENGPANILLENHVKYEDLGDDFQQAKNRIASHIRILFCKRKKQNRKA
ncbi:MAG: hypothetical protein RLZZ205_558 [Bacteroidota bacterium]|jgi:hypothetical protein